jgi:hypothetical protein
MNIQEEDIIFDPYKNQLDDKNLLTKYLQFISMNYCSDIEEKIPLFIKNNTLIQFKKLTTEQLDLLIHFLMKNNQLSYLENNLLIFQNISHTILTIPTLLKKDLFLFYHQKEFDYFHSNNIFNIFMDIFESRIEFYGDKENQNIQYQNYLSDIFDIFSIILLDKPSNIQYLDFLSQEPFARKHFQHFSYFYFQNQNFLWNNIFDDDLILKKIYAIHNHWKIQLSNQILSNTLKVSLKQYHNKI